VTAEVSDKDTANSITLLGTTVPGITKRRVQSTVDMNFGDTMVVAGMINSRVMSTYQKTPFLGEVPGLGLMFSKKVTQETETELVILITPEFGSSLAPAQVPYGGPGMFTTAPTDREMYLHGLIEVPKFGPNCGPECQPGQTFQPNQTFQGSGNSTGSPILSPTLSPAISPACAPNKDGLIGPPGTDSPGVAVPSPSSDPGVTKRTFSGSSWPSKPRGIASTKSKSQGTSTNTSSVQPAGFKSSTKSDRTLDKRSSDVKGDDQE
jgi:pilus assembly protein CpaC